MSSGVVAEEEVKAALGDATAEIKEVEAIEELQAKA